METEPAIAQGGRHPIAVVRPTSLLPSPVNPVSSVLDNVQRQSGVSGRQELPVQNLVTQAATVSYLDTMGYFDPAHYDALLEGFDCKEYPLEILEAATRLLETCNSRRIRVKPTLFSMLKFHGINQHPSDLKTFYEKCNVFFTALNTDVTGDTACLTSMLNKSNTSTIKRVSDSFISKADDEIQYIAQSPFLKNISSMCSTRGLPEKTKVEAFLKLPCLKEGWQEGKDDAVKDKPLDRALVTNISSMCNGKGLPEKTKVEAFVQWLPSDEKKSLLIHSCRIFASFGLPSGEKLTEDEKTLRQCLNQHGCTTEHGDDNSDEDDDLLESSQMKALVLFFSGPAKWRIKIAEFQQYLAAHKSPRNDRVAVRAALKSLLPILAIHGGVGIQFWIEKHRENPRCKEVLTKALSIPAPLALTKFVLTQLPEPERQEYLELCRNLKPAPTLAQWKALKPLRQQLGERFEYTLSKRIMLEILWQQSEDNRSKYAGKMDELFKTVPTISQWRGLHRVLGPHKTQLLMDACLEYQAKPETAPDVTVQQRLLEGMLLTNHNLPEHGKIPDLCFSNRVSTDDKSGVIVSGDPPMTIQERLWSFIKAMLIELEQTEYQFKNQRLTVLPADGEPVVLQNPEFTLRDTGFVIKNWTLQQLTAFFKATEFTEQWYKKPQEKRDLCAIRLEAKLAQMKVRTKEPEKAEPKKIPHLVAPSLIISLINCNKPLKPAVWSSLEHYASSGELTTSLCKALNPVIQKDNDGVVPGHIKNAVAAKLVQIEATKTPVVTAASQQRPLASTPTQGNQVSNSSIQGPLSTFVAAMEALDRFKVLRNAELELLEPHRSQMTYIELSTAISKMSYAVDSETRKEWNEASEKKRRDPLGLDEILEADFDLLATHSQPGNNPDWLEELLQ